MRSFVRHRRILLRRSSTAGPGHDCLHRRTPGIYRGRADLQTPADCPFHVLRSLGQAGEPRVVVGSSQAGTQFLRPEIERVWEQNYKVYGVRKVWHQMKREGFDVARCTVARLMKDLGLEGVIRGKKARTTIPDKSQPCPLDKVNRQFRVPAPNMLWVSDFTYVATWQGFVYVAFVIDAFARRIVGWRVSRTANAGFVLDALEQAVHQRQPGSGLVHHSDRGSQYLSIRYTERLADAGIETLGRERLVTRMTTHWRKPSTACSRRRSSTAVAHGAASTPWNTPPSNGSTGSTTAACWSPTGTSRQQRPKQTITRLWILKTWPRNLNQTASGKTRRGSRGVLIDNQGLGPLKFAVCVGRNSVIRVPKETFQRTTEENHPREAMTKAVILNDTREDFHHGCSRVMTVSGKGFGPSTG